MAEREPLSVLTDVAGLIAVNHDTVVSWIAMRELAAHRLGWVRKEPLL